MRANGGALFSVGLALVAGYAVAAAWSWPTKAALFPLVIGVPLFVLAAAQLVLQLRAPEPPLEPERRRTLATFGWMAGFIVLVVLGGFPTAVPLFIFSYLMVQRAAPWWQSIALAATAWGVFHLLFERLLRFPFDGGLVRTWLGFD